MCLSHWPRYLGQDVAPHDTFRARVTDLGSQFYGTREIRGAAIGHDKTAIKKKKHVTRPIGGNLLDSRVGSTFIRSRYYYSTRFIPPDSYLLSPPYNATTLDNPFSRTTSSTPRTKFVPKFVIRPHIPPPPLPSLFIHSNLSPNNHVLMG